MKLVLIAIIFMVTALTGCVNDKINSNENNQAAKQPEASNGINKIPIQRNSVMPSFTVEDAGGKLINLQSLRGKKIFVNLWASWCPPCRREMPSIEKLSASLDTNKVAFIMLSIDDNFNLAKKFMINQKLRLPVYYPTEKLPELFNVQGIPATFIFNENGELIQRIEGAENYDTDRYRELLK